MAPGIGAFLALMERQMVEKLLRSPSFHRGVGHVHKFIQEKRFGKLPEDMGGTKIDNPNKQNFWKLFVEELKSGYKGDVGGKKP